MSQIKTYRVELIKKGEVDEVNIYGRKGEVINNIQPKEKILRTVKIPVTADDDKWDVLVHQFIERLINAGYEEV
ncbi:hypothetical protein K9692_003705 [Escherichia coli]|uniref:hypothetical protein n=1 Tax=Buttiauxella gaviniae TaxID=82990 RepID=UPI001DA10BFD|nr:hypothetical protein [Escherichia coli]